MSAVQTLDPNHVVLHNIRWPTFEALLDDLGDQRGRIAYDRGTLEIMSPSKQHEALKTLIGRLIEAFSEELNLDISSCGSTTLKSQLKERGVEPDECYYLQNEPAVRDHEEIDLERDPPPDLVVEVEVTKKFLDRKSIYAALGVPEVWLHDGKTLRVLRLQASGDYKPSIESGVFADLSVKELSRFLDLRRTTRETALVRAFRAWVRERFPTR